MFLYLCRHVHKFGIYIKLEKDGEKEKLGGRPTKLNEKKGNRDLEREIKNKGDSFFVGKTT